MCECPATAGSHTRPTPRPEGGWLTAATETANSCMSKHNKTNKPKGDKTPHDRHARPGPCILVPARCSLDYSREESREAETKSTNSQSWAVPRRQRSLSESLTSVGRGAERACRNMWHGTRMCRFASFRFTALEPILEPKSSAGGPHSREMKLDVGSQKRGGRTNKKGPMHSLA